MKNIIITSLLVLGSFFVKGYSQSPADDLLGVSCTVTTDKQIYTVGENVIISISLKNTGQNVVTLGFPTVCAFDYYIDYSYHLLQGAFCLTLYWDIVLNPGQVYTSTYTHKSNQYLIGAGFHQIKGVSQSMPSYYGTTTIQVTNQLPAIQTLIIPAGWSGISSYLNPANPNLVNLMAPVASHLLMIKNNTNSYSPPLGIMPTAPWNSTSGYFIKLDAPVQLAITGFEIQNKTIALSVGWNLVPVVSNGVYSCNEIMSGLNFEIVKAAVGTDVYWPSKDIQTLYFFEAGKAYLIKMNSPGSITFP
ncbi:MAG: hypothetical protein ACOYMF_14815 [Bacteroidales bacterium]